MLVNLALRARMVTAQLTILILVGCSVYPASPLNMTPTDLRVVNQNDQTVFIDVIGGQESDMGTPGEISGNDFRKAVIGAVQNHRLFGSVNERNKADYILSAQILQHDSRKGTFTLLSNMTVFWSLRSQGQAEDRWSATLHSDGKATLSDGINGLKRGLVASERAAKQNIQDALETISSLELP
jgi:hypothetical protein